MFLLKIIDFVKILFSCIARRIRSVFKFLVLIRFSTLMLQTPSKSIDPFHLIYFSTFTLYFNYIYVFLVFVNVFAYILQRDYQ